MTPSSTTRDLVPDLLAHVVPPPATPALLEAALGRLADHLVAELPGVDDVTVVLTGPLTLPVEERTARIAAASGGAGTAVAPATADSWLGPCVTAMVGLVQVVAERPAIEGTHPHLLPALTTGGLAGLVASPLRPESGGAGVLTAYSSSALPDAEGRGVLELVAAAAGAALDDVRGTVPGRASAPARAARAIAVEDDAAEAEGWVVLGELAAEWQVDVPAAAARVLAAG